MTSTVPVSNISFNFVPQSSGLLNTLTLSGRTYGGGAQVTIYTVGTDGTATSTIWTGSVNIAQTFMWAGAQIIVPIVIDLTSVGAAPHVTAGSLYRATISLPWSTYILQQDVTQACCWNAIPEPANASTVYSYGFAIYDQVTPSNNVWEVYGTYYKPTLPTQSNPWWYQSDSYQQPTTANYNDPNLYHWPTVFYPALSLSIYRDGSQMGGWTDWQWSQCSAQCGPGTQTATRTCTNPAPVLDGYCIGSSTTSQACYGSQPCPVDGGWTDWSWSACSKQCGGGTQNGVRSCTNPVPQFGGQPCQGSSTTTQPCNTQPCSTSAANPDAIDGGWSDWTDWSQCSVSCGGGTQTRTRTCSNPMPMFGGADCQGDSLQTQACNVDPCPTTTQNSTVVTVETATPDQTPDQTAGQTGQTAGQTGQTSGQTTINTTYILVFVYLIVMAFMAYAFVIHPKTAIKN